MFRSVLDYYRLSGPGGFQGGKPSEVAYSSVTVRSSKLSNQNLMWPPPPHRPIPNWSQVGTAASRSASGFGQDSSGSGGSGGPGTSMRVTAGVAEPVSQPVMRRPCMLSNSSVGWASPLAAAHDPQEEEGEGAGLALRGQPLAGHEGVHLDALVPVGRGGHGAAQRDEGRLRLDGVGLGPHPDVQRHRPASLPPILVL